MHPSQRDSSQRVVPAGPCKLSAAGVAAFAYSTVAMLGSPATLAVDAEVPANAVSALSRPDPAFAGTVQVVVFIFLFTVVLAIAVAYAARRWSGVVLRSRGSSQAIRTIERAVVSQTLSVYLLEIAGDRYVVAEGKSGIALTREAGRSEPPQS